MPTPVNDGSSDGNALKKGNAGALFTTNKGHAPASLIWQAPLTQTWKGVDVQRHNRALPFESLEDPYRTDATCLALGVHQIGSIHPQLTHASLFTMQSLPLQSLAPHCIHVPQYGHGIHEDILSSAFF
eukprot:1157428-Pelagomonas_calceolata.AAC.2